MAPVKGLERAAIGYLLNGTDEIATVDLVPCLHQALGSAEHIAVTPAPEPGAIITLDGREAGEMRSSRDGIGLALLRLEAVESGGPLAAGTTIITPVTPDWMRIPE